MEKLKEIQKYLSIIDPTVFEVVITHMLGKVHPNTGGDCVGNPPTSSPTPNGHWICSNGSWVWVPEIGD